MDGGGSAGGSAGRWVSNVINTTVVYQPQYGTVPGTKLYQVGLPVQYPRTASLEASTAKPHFCCSCFFFDYSFNHACTMCSFLAGRFRLCFAKARRQEAGDFVYDLNNMSIDKQLVSCDHASIHCQVSTSKLTVKLSEAYMRVTKRLLVLVFVRLREIPAGVVTTACKWQEYAPIGRALIMDTFT